MTDTGPDSLAAAHHAAAETGRIAAEMTAAEAAAAADKTAAADRLQQQVEALQAIPGDPAAADLDAYFAAACEAAETCGAAAAAAVELAAMLDLHARAVLSVRTRAYGPPAHLVAHADQVAAAHAAQADDAVDRWRTADDT